MVVNPYCMRSSRFLIREEISGSVGRLLEYASVLSNPKVAHYVAGSGSDSPPGGSCNQRLRRRYLRLGRRYVQLRRRSTLEKLLLK